MKKLEQIYEGKAKKVYRTDGPALYIVDYKDRFLRDLGGVEAAYAEIMKRLVDHEEK